MTTNQNSSKSTLLQKRIPKKKVYATPLQTRKKLSVSLTDKNPYTDEQADFTINLPNISGSLGGRTISKIKKFDARQPLALMQAKKGSSVKNDETVSSQIYRQLDLMIQEDFDQSPTQGIFQFQGTWGKVHLSMVTVPNGFTPQKYLVVSNPAGKVDIIEYGRQAYKHLQIESMQCTHVQGSYLFIGAANKMYLLDMAQEFTIVSQLTLSR